MKVKVTNLSKGAVSLKCKVTGKTVNVIKDKTFTSVEYQNYVKSCESLKSVGFVSIEVVKKDNKVKEVVVPTEVIMDEPVNKEVVTVEDEVVETEEFIEKPVKKAKKKVAKKTRKRRS